MLHRKVPLSDQRTTALPRPTAQPRPQPTPPYQSPPANPGPYEAGYPGRYEGGQGYQPPARGYPSAPERGQQHPAAQPGPVHGLRGYDARQVPESATPYQAAVRGAHLPPYREPLPDAEAALAAPTAAMRTPRKITVTRVAAMRSRELTLRGVDLFHRATTADGADRSGLAHLTYAQMANYACDAALAIALANTLFLVKPEEGPGRVLLYLLITIAPFALVAPLIGPFLDRLQTGRRLALATSMAGRGLLAIPMVFTFTGNRSLWVLYPCALGSLVLSKSFSVLKASLTPRVLPESITLVATNSRLTVFGLIAGGVAGGLAAGLTWLFASPGALVFSALLGFSGAYLCMKIPAWVESTAGEVPVHLSPRAARNEPTLLSVPVRATLWAASSIRIETGFLAMFIAFVVMKEYAAESGFYKLLLVGVVGVAAGFGGFVGNALGAKLPLRTPETIALIALAGTILSTAMAALLPGLAMASVVGFVGATASALAKVCLDSVVQRDVAEVSRASAFGRSETALQLAWVFGGVVGLLIGGLLELSHSVVYTIGFVTVTMLLGLGATQTWLARGGRSILPALPSRRRRAKHAPPAVPQPVRQPDGTYTARLEFGAPDEAPTEQWPVAPRIAGTPRAGEDPRQPGRPRLRYSRPKEPRR